VRAWCGCGLDRTADGFAGNRTGRDSASRDRNVVLRRVMGGVSSWLRRLYDLKYNYLTISDILRMEASSSQP